jgi:cell wall-associated NlpC family hydrolase
MWWHASAFPAHLPGEGRWTLAGQSNPECAAAQKHNQEGDPARWGGRQELTSKSSPLTSKHMLCVAHGRAVKGMDKSGFVLYIFYYNKNKMTLFLP